MKVSLLASSSKANSTCFYDANTKILIDAGLSAKQLNLRLEKIGVESSKINAIFITHEHSDHIRGISVFSRKYKVPVYVPRAVAPFIDEVYELNLFDVSETIKINEFKIKSFSIVHDAVDPVGYYIESKEKSAFLATDVGVITPLIKEYSKKANFIVIESNYDQDLLNSCDYSWDLKQRISSSYGHLSNEDCYQFIKTLKNKNLEYLFLAHLSENSNTEDLVKEKFHNLAANLGIEYEVGSPVRVIGN